MTESQRQARVYSPVVTPFDDELAPDAQRLVAHCRWLLDNDVGLAVFGTNSEANSLSASEKLALLDALVDAGLPTERMMPGTGCCALTDSVALTRAAVAHGCGGVLMLPPFYYKNVSDEGLFRNYAEVIERTGDARLRIYLYHIPAVAGVPIPLSLIERLLKHYPGTVAGIKDSSGDWNNTEAMLRNFGDDGFEVFCGSETFLLDTLRNGGAGCISATANVHPGPIAALARDWQGADAETRQQHLDRVRGVFEGYVMIAGLKAAIAHFGGDDTWRTTRPPLLPLSAADGQALAASLGAVGFDMPGLPGAD